MKSFVRVMVRVWVSGNTTLHGMDPLVSLLPIVFPVCFFE
jgi:hypothetical protein